MKNHAFFLLKFLFCFSSASLFGMTHASAADMPFTDVGQDSPYYESVQQLHNAGIISDEGDHLFHPDLPMNRDFFAALAVSVGCKKCQTPSKEDIFRYSVSPFIDLPKTNRHYYCIAYGAEQNIIQ